MLTLLKKNDRLGTSLFLLFCTLFCASLLYARMYITQNKAFVLLNWNLFLAIVPWLLTSLMMLSATLRKSKLVLFIFLCVWLLFFPNSPYILTDLIHLKKRAGIPMWFDLLMILSYAWTGLLFGFVSLQDIHRLLYDNMSKWISNCIIVFLLFLGSAGIFLGRFLRWNSWDIIHRPKGIANELSERIFNPEDYLPMWLFTLVMGVLLNTMYWSVSLLKKNSELSV
ncbi:MAG: DUF1361 domain-containing protein [Bacteroidetes bacterium]|nr:DUF1361 domain-containing protein [Bacteroidota bacterium]